MVSTFHQERNYAGMEKAAGITFCQAGCEFKKLPVICLHGIGGNYTSFEKQISELGQRRVISWNMPGYYGSEALDEMTFLTLAESVIKLMDSLGINQAHILGQSIGGMIALETAFLKPDFVKSLVLIATTSAFGGIIAFNKEINEATALLVMNQFVEVLIAPSFSDEAMRIFKKKDNVRLLSVPIGPENDLHDYKKIAGGWLVQTIDDHKLDINKCEVVSKLKPTKKQLEDMLFAWKVTQFVKSNAIVFCNKGQTLGVGAGQMSRIDSTKIAGIKAQNAGLSLTDSIVASDAFFPFRDGVDELAKYGAKCVIQPGGSLRDKEVIEAADEHGLVMIFTKIRHFKH